MRKRVLAIFILCMTVMFTACNDSENGNFNINGNSISNIVNSGLASIQNETIYYCTENGLYRMENDGSEEKQLFSTENGDCIYSINVVKDWIYYENFIDGERNLYKIKTDGTDNQKIDEIGKNTRVINNVIYRWERPYCYTMDLDGKNKKEIFKHSVSSDYTINFSEEWIYLCAKLNDEYGIYRISLDGEQTELLFSGRTDYMVVNNDYIYFKGYRDHNLYKMKTSGSEPELVFDNKILWCFSIADNFIYYCDYDKNGLWRVNLDGTQSQQVYSGQVSDINVVGDWIFYTDESLVEGQTIQCRVKVDGTEWKKIGVRNETYYGDIPKKNENTINQDMDLSNVNLQEYVGTYSPCSYIDSGTTVSNITLDINGIVTGGMKTEYNYSKSWAGTKPTSIVKNSDGTITCEISETEDCHEYYIIYPIGVSDRNNMFDKDKVRIEYIIADGGILGYTYYKIS